MIRRRALLRGCLATSLATFAGCSNRKEAEPGAVRLCSVELSNSHDDPHDLSLTVEYDGETIFDRSFSLDAMQDHTQGGGTVEYDWPDEPGRYEISASLAGGESRRWNLGNLYPGERMTMRADVTIARDGSLELWHTKEALCEA